MYCYIIIKETPTRVGKAEIRQTPHPKSNRVILNYSIDHNLDTGEMIITRVKGRGWKNANGWDSGAVPISVLTEALHEFKSFIHTLGPAELKDYEGFNY